jgi:chorismate mutase
MHVVAIRGATTVAHDAAELIREATRELLAALVAANGLDTGQIISAIFTMTQDLRGEFPARAAREMGWHDVPPICAVEIDVPGALQRCVRVLLHVSTARPRSEVKHVYLREAVTLRSPVSERSRG